MNIMEIVIYEIQKFVYPNSFLRGISPRKLRKGFQTIPIVIIIK